MKVFIVALCIAFAAAGVVDHVPCGGTGTFNEARINGCQGEFCEMNPGVTYDAEGVFTAGSSAASITIKVHATYLGSEIPIIDEEISGSAIVPGTQYTVGFSVTPSTLLSGQSVPITVNLVETAVPTNVQVCATVQVRIN